MSDSVEELGGDVALGRAEGAAQADLRAALEHGDDHDVGDADAADEQGHRAEAEEERGERVVGLPPGPARRRTAG